jgi:hypothetical protein
MASGTPVQSVKEHKKITDEIDDMYMDTLFAEANLQTFLVQPRGGNRGEQVLFFYRAFRGLFTHTRHLKGMDEITEEEKKKNQNSLIEDVEEWFLDGTNPLTRKRKYPDEFVRRGLLLFSKYQKKLIAKAVVSVTR